MTRYSMLDPAGASATTGNEATSVEPLGPQANGGHRCPEPAINQFLQCKHPRPRRPQGWGCSRPWWRCSLDTDWDVPLEGGVLVLKVNAWAEQGHRPRRKRVVHRVGHRVVGVARFVRTGHPHINGVGGQQGGCSRIRQVEHAAPVVLLAKGRGVREKNAASADFCFTGFHAVVQDSSLAEVKSVFVVGDEHDLKVARSPRWRGANRLHPVERDAVDGGSCAVDGQAGARRKRGSSSAKPGKSSMLSEDRVGPNERRTKRSRLNSPLSRVDVRQLFSKSPKTTSNAPAGAGVSSSENNTRPETRRACPAPMMVSKFSSL